MYIAREETGLSSVASVCCRAQSKFPGLFIGFFYPVPGKSPRGIKIAAKSKRRSKSSPNKWLDQVQWEAWRAARLPFLKQRQLAFASQVPAVRASSGRSAGGSRRRAPGWGGRVAWVCCAGGEGQDGRAHRKGAKNLLPVRVLLWG